MELSGVFLMTKYFIQYPIQIICGLQCPYCLHKEAWELLAKNKYEDKFSNNCPFTFEQYQTWRDKHLFDATDILMELHGGEMSYGDNQQLTIDIIDKADKERFQLQSNGLGDRNFYAELAKRKDKIERIGFTYHRPMLQDNEVLTNKFEHNVRALKGWGIKVYVKELLFLEYKDAILKNKKTWELQDIEFRIQDYRGEGGFNAPKYTNEDFALVDREYHHVLGAECSCRAGYKNIIIRGYDANAYAFGGDVLACWGDPCVIGNINKDWYNPNYTVYRGNDNSIGVATACKVYRGTYPQDRYAPEKENEFMQLSKYQLKQRGISMLSEKAIVERAELLNKSLDVWNANITTRNEQIRAHEEEVRRLAAENAQDLENAKGAANRIDELKALMNPPAPTQAQGGTSSTDAPPATETKKAPTKKAAKKG